MRILFFALLTFFIQSASSQTMVKKFSADWTKIDRIENKYKGNISSDSLEIIENNEFENQVRQFTLDLIKKGIVTYPYGMLHYDLASTYQMILLEMQVDFNDFVKQESDVSWSTDIVYYSEMFNYFESKFGKGYFAKIKSQADSLDQLKLGLLLPKILNVESTRAQLKSIINMKFLEIMKFENVDDLYLTFRVNKSKIVHDIEICKFGVLGLCNLENISLKYSSEIANLLNEFKWEYSTFRGKFTDRKIVFRFDTEEIRFDYFEK